MVANLYKNLSDFIDTYDKVREFLPKKNDFSVLKEIRAEFEMRIKIEEREKDILKKQKQKEELLSRFI